MILNQNTRNIERSGIKVERQATIQADAVAFKVLSDMLYPDKPLAIIRELLCNAYDSHTDAGIPDTPVSVHLPNIMEPYLSIRDYGLGLSFRDACVLMLTYFKSTKRKSNKVTGALGLGSKTPFSYVDSYTVTTRFNGRKFVFNAYINEDGMPSMALMHRERTDESNGVEIMVPVRRSDFDVFYQRAQQVIQWFRIPPIVTGYPGFEALSHDYEMHGSNWKIAKQHHYQQYSAFAIQGNIAYPIVAANMPQLPPGYSDMLRLPIHIMFDIGDISFTAGRDAISYDPATVKNLMAALDTFVQELPLHFQNEFDTCKTEWEAKCVYNRIVNRGTAGSILRTLSYTNKLKFNWRGTDISSAVASIDLAKLPSITVQNYYGNQRVSTYSSENRPTFGVSGEETTIFYINDLPKGGITRIRELRKTIAKNDVSIYMIGGNDSELTEVTTMLGNPKFRKTSELPKPTRAGYAVSRTFIRQFFINGARSSKFINANSDLDMSDGGLYIPILRDKAIDSERENIVTFSQTIQIASKLGLLDVSEQIYGASPKVLKQFASNNEWRNVLDVLKERFIAKINLDNIADQVASVGSYNNWYSSEQYIYRALAYVSHSDRIINTLGAKHRLSIFQEKIKEINKVSSNQLDELATLLHIDFNKSNGKPNYDFSDEWDIIIKLYPVINILHYPQSSDSETIISYIKMMDQLHELQK